MSGFDLIVKKMVSLSEVRESLSIVFGVPENFVVSINGYPEETLPSGIKILSISTEVAGDFQIHLSVELLAPELNPDFSLIAANFSRVLNSECLLPDSSDNPYSMTLVSPDSSIRRVYLRADDLDNETYRLI
ncbi:hypothetical protein [Andreprevotia lacus]|jgi:hypothetical protein|uniref:hypothetical protein n=1 Tax=Andreprevotia lacus TaxID=1121000 RepID=UPI00111BCF4F|nr:hypothetical protein [Andreprevotia lacus]